jgi:mevalonate kinase
VRLLVGDTGVRSSTRLVVGDVRQQWQAQPERFERLFTACGRLAEAARQALEAGELAQLGQLMQENHALLQEMSVSSAGLDALVSAALVAGALGAKLSGAGRGGNMIALVTEEREVQVREGLLTAGARAVLQTVLPAGSEVPA